MLTNRARQQARLTSAIAEIKPSLVILSTATLTPPASCRTSLRSQPQTPAFSDEKINLFSFSKKMRRATTLIRPVAQRLSVTTALPAARSIFTRVARPELLSKPESSWASLSLAAAVATATAGAVVVCEGEREVKEEATGIPVRVAPCQCTPSSCCAGDGAATLLTPPRSHWIFPHSSRSSRSTSTACRSLVLDAGINGASSRCQPSSGAWRPMSLILRSKQ